VSRNTTLVPSLGLRIGPACEASLSADMRRERVSLAPLAYEIKILQVTKGRSRSFEITQMSRAYASSY